MKIVTIKSSRHSPYAAKSSRHSPYAAKSSRHSPYAVTLIAITLLLATILNMNVLAGTWRDDFEDNNTQEWKIFNLDRQAEKWWINNNEAVGEIFLPGFMSLWMTGELTWKNYSVSCRAKLVKQRHDLPSIGLTLHDRGHEDNRYLFFIHYELDIVEIVKWHPDFAGASSRHQFEAEFDTWYELTAAVEEDGTLSFQIDEKVFTVIDDNPLKGGLAGLVVANAQARFDDVAIKGANIPNGGPGKARPVIPRDKLATTWGTLKSR